MQEAAGPAPLPAGMPANATGTVAGMAAADLDLDPATGAIVSVVPLTGGSASAGSPEPDQATTEWSDLAMARMVPLAPATLGASMTCLALAHLASLEGIFGGYLSVTSGTVGIALSLSAFAWRRHRLGRRSLHAIMSGCLVLAGADTVAYAMLSGNLERTADLMLLVVAAGLVLLDRRWYLGTLAILVSGWVALAATAGPARGLQVVALGMAVALGAGIRAARLTGLREVQQLQATASLAMLDPLTGLPDRRGVHLVAAHLLAIARRESGAVGCTFVGIAGFEDVAAAVSQRDADALLAWVASVLKGSVRGTDVVARWTASEFVVVTHGQGAPREVFEARIAQRLAEGCPVPADLWDGGLRLGYAVLEPWDEGGLAATLAAAERDMYERAGVTPPQASADVLAEFDAARSLQQQAAEGQLVSEVIAEVATTVLEKPTVTTDAAPASDESAPEIPAATEAPEPPEVMDAPGASDATDVAMTEVADPTDVVLPEVALPQARPEPSFEDLLFDESIFDTSVFEDPDDEADPDDPRRDG